MGQSSGFSQLVKQANQLSSEISEKRNQHRTFSGSGNRLLNADFSNEPSNELQMSLGPSVKDQKRLDDMVNVARA
jgi:hypothetical protein